MTIAPTAVSSLSSGRHLGHRIALARRRGFFSGMLLQAVIVVGSMLGSFVMTACLPVGGGTGDNDDLLRAGAEANLNAGITLPGDGGTLTDPTVDETIELEASFEGSMDAMPNDVVDVAIPFTAPNGNVVGAGIRFGETGPIRVVPVPGAQGQQQGTLNFQFQIPPTICDNLSQVCHDIKCYEFAVTADGRVSRANINDLALACNNCTEPSCQDLLTMCELDGTCRDDVDCGTDQICFEGSCVGQGRLRVSLSWTSDDDFDLHLLTSNGSEIYYGAPAADGGMLDVDDCAGGCSGGSHVENIFFNDTLASGEYTVWVENFSGGVGDTYRIEVSGDATESWSGWLPGSSNAESERYRFTVD